MGYVLLGIAMGDKYGLTGAGFQMFAHGIMTALFFALIGYVYEKTHTRVIADISGLMKAAPLVAACFVIAGASSMGLPSTAGFVAELLVKPALNCRYSRGLISKVRGTSFLMPYPVTPSAKSSGVNSSIRARMVSCKSVR